MQVSIRKFEKKDIKNKVKWINNPLNNTYLHYEIPLEIEKTEKWFKENKNREDRYDAIIEVDNTPVGLIGLLSIDRINKKAEYYVTLGERDYLGKGIAAKASRILLNYAFQQLELNRIYLYTETDNLAAVKSYERIGFKREGIIRKDLFSKGRFVDRYVYGITKNDFYGIQNTPIYALDKMQGNNFYIKREDFIPISFGGNKARKAKLFFEEIDRENYDCVVTYGSSSSNHCRVVANMASARKMKCYIISPEETSEETYNSKMMELFGAEIVMCPVRNVRETIEKKIQSLEEKGYHPYFIQGGGHGNVGTQAYVNCYEEIREYEKEHGRFFDYIFHASGTGTTQAGLVCGQLINRDERNIVGISIARKNPKGREVIVDSIREYLQTNGFFFTEQEVQEKTVFTDKYIGNGYGSQSDEVEKIIRNMLIRYGIPMDSTYVGKAYRGMQEYIKEKGIVNKNILFIHTGGTPLFFDDLKEL